MGEKVKNLRKEKNLTQKESSNILSIGWSTLACYKTDRNQIHYATLIAIAKFFDVSADYLLGLED